MQPGDRIELVQMENDPNPIAPGTKGTITSLTEVNLGPRDRFTQVGVKWDDGRTLMLCTPPDRFRVLPEGA